MSEPNSETGTSGGAPEGTSGATGGAGGGAAEGISQAQFDKVQMEARAHQARADRAEARARELEGTNKPPAPEAPATLTQADIDRAVNASLSQYSMLAAARTQLSQEFPSARPDVLNGQFATPEEMALAVRNSHESEQAYRDKIRDEESQRVIADFVKRNPGIDIATPQTPAAGEGGDSALSIRDVQKMTPGQIARLPEDVLQAALANGG